MSAFPSSFVRFTDSKIQRDAVRKLSYLKHHPSSVNAWLGAETTLHGKLGAVARQELKTKTSRRVVVRFVLGWSTIRHNHKNE